jgi:NAD-dependent dihydropyrimidine dehydrogenase PreA subunit
MSDSIIYYYSGTGNSLHVTRELKQRLPGTEIVPILSVLKEGITVQGAKQVGLVFPIYVSTIPKPVRAFLDLINLSSIQYLYTVTTNGGIPGKVDYLVYKLLQSKGFELDYYASLKMIVNTATGLMPAFMINKKWADLIHADKVAKMELELQKELELVAKSIKNRAKNIGPDCQPTLARKALLSITEKISPLEKANAVNFFVDQDCNGCGTCEKVCPSEKVKLTDGRPEWSEKIQCYYCYACFNFCPQQAILVKGYKYKTGRYRHPNVSAADIAGQKD